MIDLVVRMSVILAVTWIASRLLIRATAATRHLLWHGALIAVLLAPLVAPLVPRVPIVPSVPAVLEVPQVLAVRMVQVLEGLSLGTSSTPSTSDRLSTPSTSSPLS